MPTARAMGKAYFEGASRPPMSLAAVFWSCSFLLDVYQEYSGSPVILKYIFPILAAVSLVLLFYTTAGYAHSRVSLSTVLTASLALLFYGLTTAGGELAFAISGSGDVTRLFTTQAELTGIVLRTFIYLYAIFYALGVLCLTGAPKDPEAEPEASAEESEGTAEE